MLIIRPQIGFELLGMGICFFFTLTIWTSNSSHSVMRSVALIGVMGSTLACSSNFPSFPLLSN